MTNGPASPDDSVPPGPVGRLFSNRFLRYLVVGTFNSAVGYGIYAVLVLLGLVPELALLLATIIGVFIAFRTTGRIVFGNKDGALLFRFIAVYATIYLINAALLRLLVVLGLSPLIAQAMLLPVTVVITFLSMRRFVFDPRR